MLKELKTFDENGDKALFIYLAQTINHRFKKIDSRLSYIAFNTSINSQVLFGLIFGVTLSMAIVTPTPFAIAAAVLVGLISLGVILTGLKSRPLQSMTPNSDCVVISLHR